MTQVINELGPEVFPDFDAKRIVADPYREGAYQSRLKRMPESVKITDASEPGTPTSNTFDDVSQPSSPVGKSFNLLPGNDAFKNIGSFGFFSSHPATPKNRSRSSSQGPGHGHSLLSGGLRPLSTMDGTKTSLEEVSKRIRGAMRERGRKRESEGETGTESSWDMASDADEEPKKDK